LLVAAAKMPDESVHSPGIQCEPAPAGIPILVTGQKTSHSLERGGLSVHTEGSSQSLRRASEMHMLAWFCHGWC